jgi:cytoskeletal protein RodZ
VTEGDHKLGEVLRAAREAKGVDLPRVERETKIRERYLSALERGEYRELPGSVYTKGFLRNYGAYLGLDSEYLIDLYRLESASLAAERPRVPAPPRPLATRRRRTFVVTPGAVAAAILTIMVGAFVAWLGYEFVSFARQPELRITDPAGNVSAHTELSIVVRGITEPKATVTVSNLRENPTVRADANGLFQIPLALVPGSNVMELTASDPVTRRESETEVRTIVVVSDVASSPSPGVATLAVEEPVADATHRDRVPIIGTAGPGSAVAVSATLVSAGTPTFSVTDASGAPVRLRPASPRTPEPLALTADPSGAFGAELALRPGTWEISITMDDGSPVTRRVTVRPARGLRATLLLRGGESYVDLDEDGTPAEGVTRGIASEGDRIELSASRDLRIRVGNAGAVRITINGIGLGSMGADGQVVEWRVTRTEG